MTNEELATVIQNEKDEGKKRKYLAELYGQNVGLIRTIAKRYQGIDLDDAMQEGYFALLDALSYYDIDRGSFSTVLVYRLKHHFCDLISKDKNISVSTLSQIAKYNRIVTRYNEEYNREPTKKELCFEMYDSYSPSNYERLSQLEKTIHNSKSIGIESNVYEDMTYSELIPSDDNVESEVLDEVEYKQLKRLLDDALNDLPLDESNTLRLMYYKGMSYSEISDKCKTEKNVIKNRKNKALRKIRTSKHIKRLHDFVMDSDRYAFDLGIKPVGIGTFNRWGTSSTEYAALKLIKYEEKEKREKIRVLERIEKEYGIAFEESVYKKYLMN